MRPSPVAAVPAARWWRAVVVAAGVLVVLGATWMVRSHWFYADDWTFLTRAGPDDLHLLVRPANGHWMGVTTVVFAGVRRLVGLGSYVPYAVPAILAHVGTALLLWRWQRHDGVGAPVAAGLTVAFLVYGAAGENLFFAVNVGFNLSLLLGLAFALLVERSPGERSTTRTALAGLVALLAVPTSTTGPVLVAAVGAWLAWRRDWRGVVLGAGPALATYGGWLLLAEGGAGLPGGSPADLVAFVGALVVTAAGRLLGADTVVVAAIVLVLVAAVVVATRGARAVTAHPRPLTWALALAGLAVAGATGMARVQYGVETWRSPRYAYVVAALLLPLLAVAVDRFARSSRAAAVVVGVVLPVAVVLNGLDLREAHRAEAAHEQHLRQRWTAAAQLLEEGVEPVAVNVDRYWSPNLHVDHLQELVASGAFPVPAERVPDPWRLEAQVELRSVLHGPSPFDRIVPADLGAAARDGCLDLEPGEVADVVVTGPSGLALRADGPTLARLHATTASGRTVALPRVLALRAPYPRALWVDVPEPTTFATTIDAGGEVCVLAEDEVSRFAASEPG